MNRHSSIITTMVALASGPVCLFGVYAAVSLDVSHGAGFAGGVIIALAVMMRIFATGLRDQERAAARSTAYTLGGISLAVFFVSAAALLTAGARILVTTEAARMLFILVNLSLCGAVACMLCLVFISLLSCARE